MTQFSFETRELSNSELNRAYIACHTCDALWLRPQLNQAERAVCSRCGTTLLNAKLRSVQRTVALTLAGLILFTVAITFSISASGKGGIVERHLGA